MRTPARVAVVTSVQPAPPRCLGCGKPPTWDRRTLCWICIEILAGACKGKIRRSKRAALASARRMSGERGRPYLAYWCDVCEFCHVGGEISPERIERLQRIGAVFVAVVPLSKRAELAQAWSPR